MKAESLPLEYLRECFTLDKTAGQLRWKQRPAEHFKTERAAHAWNRKFAGKTAGYGFGILGKVVKIESKTYSIARIVWALHYGEVLNRHVVLYHRNGDRRDNRVINLLVGSRNISEVIAELHK